MPISVGCAIARWPEEPSPSDHRRVAPSRRCHDDRVPQFVATQLHHVAVVVNDLAAAREFYCDLLGLSEMNRPEFPTRGLWLAVGDAQVHVAEGDDPVPRRHHFALAVDDLGAAITDLEGAGLEVRRFPVVEGAGAQAGVRDPSGNLIELRQAE